MTPTEGIQKENLSTESVAYNPLLSCFSAFFLLPVGAFVPASFTGFPYLSFGPVDHQISVHSTNFRMTVVENPDEIYSNDSQSYGPLSRNTPSTNKPPPHKLRWGELDEEDGEDLDFLLPPAKIIGPDEHGVKKIIEFKFNDEGQKVKITTTTRTRKLAKARLNKRALERREWRKFGDAVNEDAGSRLTMVSTEEILLERPRAPGTKAEDPKAAGDPLAALGKGGAVLMVCRTCGKKGDHWTSKCPYKDLAPAQEGLMDKVPTIDGAAPGASKGTYVPPSLRAGAERSGTEMRRRNEENSVRVTNLSEDTREADLHELFRTFGAITRVYVAVDQKTGMSRGFGFVNFVNREDAQRAINKLNGYGYDNLILRVEWATPRQT